MLSSLASIIVLGLLAMLWLSGARAREMAVAISRKACDGEGYQLLDDSVALQRIGLRWTGMYRFEYSIDGTLREIGYVILLGYQLESVHIRGRHTTRPGRETGSQGDSLPRQPQALKTPATSPP